jgi:hypothetical protein
MFESSPQPPMISPEEPYSAPFELAAVVNTHEQWPDLNLSPMFSQQNLFGSSLLHTNKDARLRSVFNTIKEVSPESFPEGPPMKTAVEYRNETDKYLRSKTSLRRGESVSKSDLVMFEMVRAPIQHYLEKANHPIFQALNGVIDLNNQRQKHNEKNYEKLAVISSAELEDLTNDLLKATLSKTIIEYYEFTIKYLKAQATSEYWP